MRQLRRGGGRRPALLPVLRSARLAGAARLPRRAAGPGHPPGPLVVDSGHARGHARRLHAATERGWAAGCGATARCFGLLSVLLLCLIAACSSATGPPGRASSRRLGREGRRFPRDHPRRSVATAPSTATAGEIAAAAAARRPKRNSSKAAKEAAKETKAEKAPPPPPKKASHQELEKLSNSTGKKHAEEINAKGAEPIETS